MDKISDFFKELKERISNPFLVSFLIAWFVFNWKIVIGLFFYDNQELKLDGYNSFIDFISKNLDTNKTLWLPFAVAMGYTLIFPFFRNLILAFNSWIKAWGNDWSLKLSKTSKISIARYIQLREVYKSRTELLEEVLDKETKYLKEYEIEKNKVLELTNQRNAISTDLDKWRTMNDISLLDGEWEVLYPESNLKRIYRVRFSNYIMEFLDTPPDNKNGKTTIRSFFRSPHSSFLTLTTVFEDNNRLKTFHFFQLDILDNMRVLRGVEDDAYKVEFTKSR